MKLFFLPVQEPVKKSKKKTSKKSTKKKKSKKQSTSDSKSAISHKTADTTTAVTKTGILPESIIHIPQKVQVEYNLFKGHELQTKQITPVTKVKTTEDWFPLVVVFIVFLISLINVFYHKKFRTFITTLFKSSSSQGTREDNVFAQRLKVLLFSLFSFITAAFLYQAGIIYEVKPEKLTGFQFFSVILFLVFFTYLLKILLNNMLGYIFKTEKETLDYTNNILLYLNILSFGLLPLVILIGFTPGMPLEILIKTGCVFILCAILFRIGRGYIIAVSNPGLLKFYLFIYLCALEILPLVVILKLFGDQFL